MLRFLKFDAELLEVAGEAVEAAEVNGVHAGFFRAFDETFHIIDEDRLFRPEPDPPQHPLIDLEVGLARADFVRREFPFEVPQQPEVLANVIVMKGVRVGDEVERVMFF